MRNHLTLAFLAAGLTVAPATARALGEVPTIPDPSVYRLNLPVDIAVSAAAGLGALVPYLIQDHIVRLRCPCDRSEVPRWERFAIGNKSTAADVASDVTLGLAIAGPLALDVWQLGWTKPLLEDVVVFGEALLVNTALTTAVKFSVQRPLPRTYANDPAFLRQPGGYLSFFSGHTSTVVTALTVFAWTAHLRYGEMWWPWVVVAVGGVSVGLERIAAGKHFPSDVLVGAGAGLAVGTAVPLLHRRPGKPLFAIVAAPGGLGVAGAF
jgi:membrane-associated phospholipid phosphatase